MLMLRNEKQNRISIEDVIESRTNKKIERG